MAVRSSDERFLRQIPLIGENGQEKLKKARILVAGAGGLGSAIAMYLAAAGVGYIRIVDEDIVENSNLNRQILYREGDIGACKVVAARQVIRTFNHGTEVDAVCRHIDETTVRDLVQGTDIILDGMDNFAARYVLNRAGLDEKIPFIHGAVNGFYGQVTTILPGITPCLRCTCPKIPFIHGAVNGFYGQVTTILPGITPCLRCIVPVPPVLEKNPIIGVTCGAVGCIEATEAIKYLAGTGEILKNRLLLWDGLRGEAETIQILKSPDCIDCGSSAIEQDVRRFRV